MTDSSNILQALAEPFAPDCINWKPKKIAGNRALAVPYIDARCVMDRLDQVCGTGWADAYDSMPDGAVLCHLSLLVGERWITRCDAGSPSEQPDAGDRHKAAVSDALKRAAVKWGLGRYLYELPPVWVAYDAQKKCLAETPRLPAWALPQERTIAEQEAIELRDALKKAPGIDPVKFLAANSVSKLTSLPVNRLATARGMIVDPPAAILRNGRNNRG